MYIYMCVVKVYISNDVCFISYECPNICGNISAKLFEKLIYVLGYVFYKSYLKHIWLKSHMINNVKCLTISDSTYKY